ncbi:MAG TPA: flippase [Terriglobales bacterium]|nr:flippase [Terriglobales bacterium]
MHKWEKNRIIKNVGSNWFSLAINVLVGMLLSPFIVHRLGDAAFGIWVLIFSITGYYGIFDLGIRSAIIRYVSKFSATSDIEGLAKVINTNLFLYICTGIASMLVTVVLALHLNSIFHIPAEFHNDARWLLLMTGASVALGFPLGMMGGVLEGLQRFYVLSWTNTVSNLLRALLIVIALDHGGGLLTVAFITVGLATLASLVRAIVAMRICPIPLGLHYVNWKTFTSMAHYSGVTFIIMIAQRLKFKTDEIVLGAMMSAAAITYFNFGARIVDYAGSVVTSLAQIFVPMASHSEAVGDMDRLRKIFVTGNRFCAFTIFPITVTLIILGKSIIEVWVGKKYVATSYPVLVIMILCCTLLWAQAASGRLLLGIGRHRTWALVTLIEGISNVVLSIILVRPYGIIGDAMGTAIPMTCSMLLFMPRHVCRQLNIPLKTYLREGYVLPLLLCLPLAGTLLLMRYWFVPHHYLQLGLHLLAGGAVYGLALGWAFLTNRATRVKSLSPQPRKHAADLGLLATPQMESFQQDV